jgi:hypothetical protein
VNLSRRATMVPGLTLIPRERAVGLQTLGKRIRQKGCLGYCGSLASDLRLLGH